MLSIVNFFLFCQNLPDSAGADPRVEHDGLQGRNEKQVCHLNLLYSFCRDSLAQVASKFCLDGLAMHDNSMLISLFKAFIMIDQNFL